MWINHVRMARRLAAAHLSLSLLRVLTVALVVAAASAVLTVANATLLRPLPFPEDDRLMRVYLLPPGITDFAQANPLHPLEFLRLRARLTGVEGFEGLWARERALVGDGEPESIPAASVSAGFFDLLGGNPAVGREFTEAEVTSGAALAVLSHGLWARRFGGDPGVIGRTILLDSLPYEVVGVMPPDFESAYVRAELWTPLEVREGNLVLPGSTFIQTLARIKPDVPVGQLADEIRRELEAVALESPRTLHGWRSGVKSLRDAQFGSGRAAVILLLIAVAALSLIAAANLGNLTLADVLQRRGDLAVRSALGATRAQLVWPEILQAALLALGGAAAGLIAGGWVLPGLIALDPAHELARTSLRMDWRVVGGTLALAWGIMIAAAAIPVLRTAGDVARTLAESGRRAAGSRGHERLRAWLVGSQTALALTLLVSGALLAEGFNNTAETDPGFDPSGILTAQLRLPEETYRTPEARAAFVTSVLERVRAIPGVVDASMTGNRFVPGFAFQTLVHVEGQPTPDGQPHTVQFRRSSPGYFRTLRIEQLRGRDFENRDTSTSPMVAIVSRSFAERFWPGEDPVGRRIRRQTPAVQWITIVGVVDDVRDVGYGLAAQATVYIPYAQNNNATNAIGLVVRTATGDPMRTASAVKAAVWSIDPAQPLSSIATLDQFLADSLGPQRFRTVLLNLLAGLGLALAAVGIYGVTARTVAERTREAGVRLALGGDPRRVWLTLAAKPMRAFGAGTVAGAIASALLATTLDRLFPEINGGLSAYAVGAALLLVLCGFAAAIIGARRVTQVDPVIALRGN